MILTTILIAANIILVNNPAKKIDSNKYNAVVINKIICVILIIGLFPFKMLNIVFLLKFYLIVFIYFIRIYLDIKVKFREINIKIRRLYMYYSTSYSSALGVITMASDGDKLIM